jgi:hypothetical protein
MLDAIIAFQPHNTTGRQRLGRRRHGDFIGKSPRVASLHAAVSAREQADNGWYGRIHAPDHGGLPLVPQCAKRQ